MKIKTQNTRVGFKHTVAAIIFILGLSIGCYIGVYELFVNTILRFIINCNNHTLDVLFVLFSILKVFLSPIIGGFIILLSYKIAEQIGK